ncbi:MAG TPA: YbhB/YbcL family Raf kinase inhibitor-like protein [Gammaproteobacteria bacterium]|nr:YbhB/YbcL family Raf kinase inhibitor-like protein [Gammaproteobacteria bacterium]
MRLFVRAFPAFLLLALPGATLAAGGFSVTSPDFANGGTIPKAQVFNGFGCKGGDVSPALHWSGAPAGTKSFAVTIYDPDAPTGSGWWHWVVFNIPANVTGLAAGAGDAHAHMLPPGAVQARSDFGFSNYGGPCPPVGDPPHHYQVTVYALKVAKLPLDADASGAMVGFELHFSTLAQAHLVGVYGRSK